MKKEDSSAQGQIITEILQHLHACNNSVKVRGQIYHFKLCLKMYNIYYEHYCIDILRSRGKFGKDKKLYAGYQ